MKKEIVDKLLSLNKSFYAQFAGPFALSRGNPQPGFKYLLEDLPPQVGKVLDVGCGNGRFGRFLQTHNPGFTYTGIDFSPELLNKASENMNGTYYQRDISKSGFLESMGDFDVIVCLSTMQHIPGRSNRMRFLSELRRHLASGGVVWLANWQFLDSERQRRKIRDWALINLDVADIEANDYLLSWQRDGYGLRYVCMIDAQETAELALEAGLVIKRYFRNDGREGNLNLYTVLVGS